RFRDGQPLPAPGSVTLATPDAAHDGRPGVGLCRAFDGLVDAPDSEFLDRDGPAGSNWGDHARTAFWSDAPHGPRNVCRDSRLRASNLADARKTRYRPRAAAGITIHDYL